MDTKLLQLHLAQAKRALDNSARNQYLDPRKSEYHANLIKLFECLAAEDFNAISVDEKKIRKELIDFIFSSMEYLDGSLFSSIPFELTYCLENALSDWMPSNHRKYIITTALRPELFCFSLSGVEDRFGQINSLYNIDFNSDLIRISLSKYLAHDYLYNIVLYHELGHFVDHYHSVSFKLTHFVFGHHLTMSNAHLLHSLGEFFPVLLDKSGTVDWTKLSRPEVGRATYDHLMEYFADLFAAQYTGSGAQEVLRYLTFPYLDHTSPSHPSTENRVKMVEDFLQGRANPVLDLIREFALMVSGQELRVRFAPVPTDDFYRMIPVEIASIAGLHGIFPAAWKVYQSDHARFQTTNSLTNGFDPQEVYTIVNNLTEKSIGNYIVKKSFDEQ
jgi:hypothetical protein